MIKKPRILCQECGNQNQVVCCTCTCTKFTVRMTDVQQQRIMFAYLANLPTINITSAKECNVTSIKFFVCFLNFMRHESGSGSGSCGK